MFPLDSNVQQELLCGTPGEGVPDVIQVDENNAYKRAATQDGVEIFWHSRLEDVPQNGHTFVVAHEFFDALPVSQFELTEAGWREILVDACNADDTEHAYEFRFLLADDETPASKVVCSKLHLHPELTFRLEPAPGPCEKRPGCATPLDGRPH
eukprot:m.142669 g.142669  ORF g.142669 m.142669 type:complete len:153 (+) comp10039_c0_seq1:593-1051(+)